MGLHVSNYIRYTVHICVHSAVRYAIQFLFCLHFISWNTPYSLPHGKWSVTLHEVICARLSRSHLNFPKGPVLPSLILLANYKSMPPIFTTYSPSSPFVPAVRKVKRVADCGDSNGEVFMAMLRSTCHCRKICGIGRGFIPATSQPHLASQSGMQLVLLLLLPWTTTSHAQMQYNHV
jgi:hypothetical protein